MTNFQLGQPVIQFKEAALEKEAGGKAKHDLFFTWT